MATEEQMTEEEMWAVILVKLEEFGRKLDDRNQRLDDTNQKLEEMNARLCGRAEPPMSSSASPTSSPPQDAALVISIAIAEFPVVAPTRCSTSGPNQDARVPVLATTSSASPTASPTSSPPWIVSAVAPIVAMELPPVTHMRCSTSGVNQAARVPVAAATPSAPPTSSSTSAPHQDTILVNPIATTKHTAVMHPRCSTMGPSQAAHVVMSALTYSALLMHSSASMGVPAPTSKPNANPWQDIVTDCLDYELIGCGQGNKMPKPPWLICAEVSNSWYGKMLLINGFLLEVSPWCREYLEFVLLKTVWPPPIPLKVASKGANLRPSPWPFFFCSEEAPQIVVAASFLYLQSRCGSHALKFSVIQIGTK
ncbi:unnamed protein product [Urochloa humidicola]